MNWSAFFNLMLRRPKKVLDFRESFSVASFPEIDCAAVGFRGLAFGYVANQVNALRCCSGLRRSPLALGFSCSGEPDVPSRGKQWNLLSFWLSIPRQWLLQSHKAELPVLTCWRQQRDVLPQWIAIQRQWLLPSALSRTEIHSQQRDSGGRHNLLVPGKTHAS